MGNVRRNVRRELQGSGEEAQRKRQIRKREVRPAGSEGGIRMKEGVRRPVSLQTKVRQQNTVIYGRERARRVIKREKEKEWREYV